MRLDAIALPLVRLALTEDIGGGDVTTDTTVDAGARARAHIEARAAGVLSGGEIAALAFRELDAEIAITWHVAEGGAVERGTRVADLEGTARAILSAERVALNFLQRLSGVATRARAFVEAVSGTQVTILDTRKTTPGLRYLEKLAARAGGAANHRFGLFDAVLIKENHVRAAGGLGAAIGRARDGCGGLPVSVEARTADEAVEAASLGADRILLDNFTPSEIVTCLKRLDAAGRGGRRTESDQRIEVEVSGGITLKNVRDFALPGVRYISVGSITHSAPALDLSLLLDGVTGA